MNKEVLLVCESRDLKDSLNDLRAQGVIPAVLYGPGVDNQNLKMVKNEFEKVFSMVGESNIFDLQIGKEKILKAIVKSVDREVVKNNIIHVDFYKIDMKKEIKAEIPLLFSGQARAVSELGGIFVKYVTHVEVECMPDKLPDHINVDISVLNDFNDHIRVGDLKLPEGVKAVNTADEMVASVEIVKEEKEVVAEEKPAEVAEVKPAEALDAASVSKK